MPATCLKHASKYTNCKYSELWRHVGMTQQLLVRARGTKFRHGLGAPCHFGHFLIKTARQASNRLTTLRRSIVSYGHDLGQALISLMTRRELRQPVMMFCSVAWSAHLLLAKERRGRCSTFAVVGAGTTLNIQQFCTLDGLRLSFSFAISGIRSETASRH